MNKWSWNKWSKYKLLKRSADLKPYLPETYLMKKTTLWRLMNKYQEVIVKPSGSSGGNGVIRIKAQGNQQFEVQEGPSIKTIEGKEHVFTYVKKRITQNDIVQRRISLASVKLRPFDLRVMVQWDNRSDWQITGKLAKVAGKGYIITNILRSKGVVLPVNQAIKRSELKSKSMNGLLATIDHVALLTANHLRKFYPSVRTMGIDMGLDKMGRVWIIEVNFIPSTSLFLKLKNKSMYRKILSFSKATKQASNSKGYTQ